MNAIPTGNPIDDLGDILAAQRAAFLRDGPPTLSRRRADLKSGPPSLHDRTRSKLR